MTAKTPFLVSLLIAFLGFSFFPRFIPSIHLLWSVPFILFALYRYPLEKALTLAFSVGMIYDLLAPGSRLGIHALCYTLTTYVISRGKRIFFEDSLSTLFLMTALFSTLLTALQWALFCLVESRSYPSGPTLFTDLIAYPLFDALFAFTLFTLPTILFGQTPRKGKEYFIR